MWYCPTPTLHLNLALTGDGAFIFSLKKTHSVWFISVLNYGDTENVLINHLLLVIPMSYPCHYTNLCPHKPHKHAPPPHHTHTHTHTHTQCAVFTVFFNKYSALVSIRDSPPHTKKGGLVFFYTKGGPGSKDLGGTYIYRLTFGQFFFIILAADQNKFKLQLYNEYVLKVHTLGINLRLFSSQLEERLRNYSSLICTSPLFQGTIVTYAAGHRGK